MLKGVYKIERNEVGKILIEFLDEVVIDNQEAICEALSLYSESTLDFVDCILIARHRVLGDEIASFDKEINKMLY